MFVSPADTVGEVNWTNLGVIGTMLVSMMGAILFYMKHLITIQMPEMQSLYLKTIDNLIKEFRIESSETRRLFHQEIGEERAHCKEQNQQLREDQEKHFQMLYGEIRVTKHSIVAVRDRGCKSKVEEELGGGRKGSKD